MFYICIVTYELSENVCMYHKIVVSYVKIYVCIGKYCCVSEMLCMCSQKFIYMNLHVCLVRYYLYDMLSIYRKT